MLSCISIFLLKNGWVFILFSMIIMQMKLKVLLLLDKLPCPVPSLRTLSGFSFLTQLPISQYHNMPFFCLFTRYLLLLEIIFPKSLKCFYLLKFQVVNALLTQMDKLKNWPNVIILTTSNITTAIGMLLLFSRYFWSTNSRFWDSHL